MVEFLIGLQLSLIIIIENFKILTSNDLQNIIFLQAAFKFRKICSSNDKV